MKLKPIQKRIDRKMIRLIEKVQNEYKEDKNKYITFVRASSILAGRINR